MLLAYANHLPAAHENLTWAIHAVYPSSADDFAKRTPMRSPTTDEPQRMLAPPREAFDVAVVNLVLHHIDDTASFLQGLKGLIKPGGWVVVTEFGMEEDGLAHQIQHGKVRPPEACQGRPC
jgi:SAM-dependent methyltransferase